MSLGLGGSTHFGGAFRLKAQAPVAAYGAYGAIGYGACHRQLGPKGHGSFGASLLNTQPRGLARGREHLLARLVRDSWLAPRKGAGDDGDDSECVTLHCRYSTVTLPLQWRWLRVCDVTLPLQYRCIAVTIPLHYRHITVTMEMASSA